MKNNALILSTALLGILFVCTPDTVRADDASNYLKDPGFELELAPDQGGWNLFEQSSFSPREARNGEKSMFNGAFSRTVAYPPYFVGSVSGSYQEFPAVAGSRWRLTGFGVAPVKLKGAPAFGIVQISFFDAHGNDLGTVETAASKTARAKTSNEVNSETPVGAWTFLDTGVATAPAGTETVQAFTIYVDFSGANIAQGVYFDDLSLCPVADDDSEEPVCKASKNDTATDGN